MTNDSVALSWSQKLEAALASGAGSDRPVVLVIDSCTSTMDEARGLMKKVSVSKPGIVLTVSQTGGRGRQGSSWVQSQSGLYTTLVFKFENALAKLAGFSLVVGCVLARVLKEEGLDIVLKWPNDLLSTCKAKVGGVLIEIEQRSSDQESGSAAYVLLGIGLNIAGAPTSTIDSKSLENRGKATASLIDLKPGIRLSPPDLLLKLYHPLFSAWEQFCTYGFEPFRNEWISFAVHLDGNQTGLPIKVDTGNEILSGKFVGLGNCGQLCLNVDGTVREIVAGHLLEF